MDSRQWRSTSTAATWRRSFAVTDPDSSPLPITTICASAKPSTTSRCTSPPPSTALISRMVSSHCFIPCKFHCCFIWFWSSELKFLFQTFEFCFDSLLSLSLCETNLFNWYQIFLNSNLCTSICFWCWNWILASMIFLNLGMHYQVLHWCSLIWANTGNDPLFCRVWLWICCKLTILYPAASLMILSMNDLFFVFWEIF